MGLLDNLTQCESCNKHIHPNKIKIYDKTIKPGIQSRQWKCIHCNHEHLVIVMDKFTRRMMKENKKDRGRIGGINRRAQNLREQNNFTSEQAQDALKQMEVIEERINKRTDELDKRSRKLIDEYKEKV